MENYTRPAPQKRAFDSKKYIKYSLLGVIGFVALTLVWLLVNFFVTFTTYRSAKDGVEILYPRKWAAKDHPAADVIVAFVSPKETALDTFMENYNLSTYDMSKEPEPMTTEAYASKIVGQIAQAFNDLNLVQKLPFIMGGHKGYKMVFRATTKVPLILSLYVFTIDDKGYNILYLGTVDRFKKDNTIMDIVALTTKVSY